MGSALLVGRPTSSPLSLSTVTDAPLSVVPAGRAGYPSAVLTPSLMTP